MNECGHLQSYEFLLYKMDITIFFYAKIEITYSVVYRRVKKVTPISMKHIAEEL